MEGGRVGAAPNDSVTQSLIHPSEIMEDLGNGEKHPTHESIPGTVVGVGGAKTWHFHLAATGKWRAHMHTPPGRYTHTL